MTISAKENETAWLLLVFSLPTKNASQRVEVWRKLKRYGVIALKSSGYVLPKNAGSEERLQWLATEIRKHKGEASVLQVAAIDNLPSADLVRMFNDMRNEEYKTLAKELQRLAKAKVPPSAAITRMRRRFQEITDRDFFHAPARRRVEQLFLAMDVTGASETVQGGRRRKDYVGKTWLTRLRPGIDRVSSAWLIRRFIDPSATFAFAQAPESVPNAIPFDMFGGKGFSHQGDNCTFETLVKEFAISDERVNRIAQAVHDADLADEKFGCNEALGLDQVLSGWANQGISDDELLRRGMEMIEGMYHAKG
jgi:hypothetical protein